MRSRVFSMLLLASTSVLFADPATGWLQTAAGTYDYNDPANWVNGEINGIFGSDLTLAGAQTLTFGADTTLSSGITANFGGGYTIKFVSDDTSISRTLTLGGDISMGSSTKNVGLSLENSILLDLGGTSRTITSTSGNATITFSSVIQNGALVLENTGRVNLYGANTYADGTDLSGTGSVYVNNNAFGTGSVTFRQGAKLDVGGGRTFTANNPLIMEGNWTFSGTSGSLDFGNCPISILQPITLTVTKNTLSLRGPIAPGSLADIAKAGGGTLATYQPIVLDNEEVTLQSSGGVWSIRGEISGIGNVLKTGGGSLEFSTASTFAGKLIIRGGNVRFRVADALAEGTKILIEEDGVLRSNTGKECNYQYSVANFVSSGILDPASSGTLAFSSHESGDIDLTKTPDLILGISGDNFNYSGALTVPEGQPVRLGTSGSTLSLTATNAISGMHDIILTGSVAFNAPNDVEGTLTVPDGKALRLGAEGSLPNVDVITGTNTTVRFVASTAGTFTRLRSLQLKTSTLTLDTPSAGDVTHVITGALIADTRTRLGGVSQIAGTGNASHVSTLHVGSIVQAEGNPCFLNIAVTPLGETMKVVVDNPPVALSESGTDGTSTQPIFPWIRANGYLLRHDADLGFVTLDSATEQQLYAEGPYDAITTPGENVLLRAATMELPGDAVINSLSAHLYDTVNPAFYGTNEAIHVLSGALDLRTRDGAQIHGNFDFGDNRGYITTKMDTGTTTLRGAFSGTGGLSFSDCTLGVDAKTLHVNGKGSTYSGDTYVYGKLYPKSADLFPNGPDRPGNLYVYGTVDIHRTMNVAINGLYGNGTVTSTTSSDHSSFIVGVDGSDGDFEGTFINGSGLNFYFTKEGAGYQRIAANIMLKYTINVNGGTLQVDGNLTCTRSGNNNIFVREGATLAGCGQFGGYNAVQIFGGATLAPGSAQKPNEPMVITNIYNKTVIPLKLENGSALRFHVDDTRASQLLVSGTVQGAYEIPVTIEGEVPYDSATMLMEAPAFEPTFTLTPDSQGSLSLVDTETTQQLWLTRGPRYTLLMLR